MEQILNYFLLAWVISGITNTLSGFIESNKLIPSIIRLVMECQKCTALWSILIISGGEIYTASLISFMIFIYGKITFLNNVEL